MQEEVSLSAFIDRLKEKGFIYSFFKKNNFIYCKDPDLNFHTHELQIEEVFRGKDPGNTGPGSVVYTIVSPKMGIKGFLLNDC